MRRTKTMWTALAIIAGVSILLIGVAIGAKMAGGIFGNDYMAGFNSAKAMLDKTGLIPKNTNKVTDLGGVIKAINGNSITLEVSRVTANPLEDQGPTERTINITDKTVIVSKIPLTSAEMAEANIQFMAGIKNGHPSSPPAPFKEATATSNDLKVGMTIAISANDDIRDTATINAAKISFQGAAAAPAPAPTKRK